MKIYFKNQTNEFPTHLVRLCTAPVIPYEREHLRQKKTITEINSSKNIENIDLDFLFNYQIFPSKLLTFLTQWNNENRAMRESDTIVQQIFIPPVRFFSQKIIVGVRIKEIFNNDNKRGFSYETLEGHVEKGISSFIVEKTSEGKLIFLVQTFSEPANLMAKLTGPIFSIPYQAYCTMQAIKNVKKQIEAQK